MSFFGFLLDVYSRLEAVSSRQHPGAGDQGTATGVVAGVQRHLVGCGVLLALISSHNPVSLVLQGGGN